MTAHALKTIWKDDFIMAISKGDVPGHRIMRALGERNNIQTGAAGEDVWRGNELSAVPSALGSHLIIPRPADAGEQMTIVSESDADNGATATGIRSIVLHYLDNEGLEQNEVKILEGTTPVHTVATNIRFVQDWHAVTVGSNTVAEGNIRIYRKTDTSRVYSMIYIGTNKALVPHKMVPANKTLHLRNWLGSEATSQKQVRMRLRADCDTYTLPPTLQPDVFLFLSVMALNASAVPQDLGYAIPAFAVVKVSTWSQILGAEVAVHWWGILVDDHT